MLTIVLQCISEGLLVSFPSSPTYHSVSLILFEVVLLAYSNIEDITREAGSMDVEEDVLLRKCDPSTLFFLDKFFVNM